MHHHTIQINHQPDATVFQFILTFVYSSTCFGNFPAHYQELSDCSGSLWFYLRIVVTVVLCSWSGRHDNKLVNCCIWLVIYWHVYVLGGPAWSSICHSLCSLRRATSSLPQLMCIVYHVTLVEASRNVNLGTRYDSRCVGAECGTRNGEGGK